MNRNDDDEYRDELNAPARRDDHHGDGATRGTDRMEAFADAVFAIAFTLPVVEIVLPHAKEGTHLGRDLMRMWPSYFGYGLASAVIGLYWVHHHFSGAIYRTTGHWFLVATVVFLAVIGFVAFPAKVLGEYVWLANTQAAASRSWVLTCSALAVAWLFKWSVGLHRDQVDARLEPAYVRRLNLRYWAFAALNALAAVLVFVTWQWGLALSSLLTLTLLWPPETPDYRTAAPIVEGES
jgi:uncharacterized membrane protein